MVAEPEASTPAAASREEGARRGTLARFLRIAGGYLHPGQRPLAVALVAGTLALVLAQVLIQFRLNTWNRAFFDALERHDTAEFVRQIGLFAVIAAASAVVAVTHLNFKMRLQLDWRGWTTRRLIDRWLAGGRPYQLGFLEGDHDNPDQRIADDVRLTIETAVDFASGGLNAVLMLITFLGVLWTLSGPLRIGEFVIPGYMVWATLLYAAAGTAVTWLFGRPLVAINDHKQGAEGDFRFHLVRARESAEAITLMRGGDDERKRLLAAFERLAGVWVRLRFATCRLATLTTAYMLLGMILPVLVASPMYFAGEITLGGLMQAVAAMVHVQTALSWLVDNYPRIAEWNASVNRVHGLADGLDALDEEEADTEAEAIVVGEHEADAIALRDLDVASAAGDVLIAGATADIRPAERVLIVGESGTGKSTLMRAVAGIWPWGRGEIRLPRDARIMFVPQRVYLPLGTLRAAMAYPLPVDAFPADSYQVMLERCGLETLVPRLDGEERWDQALSGGEQQRLAFARLLLHRPDWIFLDEATSALDEAGQAALMGMLRTDLPDAAVVSIGHRPGLEAFHDRTMTLVKGEDGAKLMRGARKRREQRRAAAAGEPTARQRRTFERLRAAVERNWRRGPAPSG